jgi:hypothetical protein
VERDPDKVTSRQEFAEYVRALSADELAVRENPTTPRFLEALSRWIEDWPEPLEPSWATLAIALTAASIYE